MAEGSLDLLGIILATCLAAIALSGSIRLIILMWRGIPND